MTWVINGSSHLDHISNYKTILGVCIALPILTTSVVAARAYTRAILLKVLGLDDWVIFFSTVSGSIRVLGWSSDSVEPDLRYHLCSPLH